MPYIVAAKQQEAVGTSISIEVVRGILISAIWMVRLVQLKISFLKPRLDNISGLVCFRGLQQGEGGGTLNGNITVVVGIHWFSLMLCPQALIK